MTGGEQAGLRDWIGHTESTEDVITAEAAAGLAATLDLPASPLVGDAVPPLWHWLAFLPRHRRSELGEDGHARRGGFLPPVALPRRMWAGGRLVFHRPITVGTRLTRVSRIADVTFKSGRSGELVFVQVHHSYADAAGVAIDEEHDIVYREAPRPDEVAPPPVPAPANADVTERVEPDPVMLFRYSALTFNGHRIHYDRSYCETVEGYPGLVVHGPLIATLLAGLSGRLASRAGERRMTGFSFRAVRPAFDTTDFDVSAAERDGGGVDAWACSPHGHLLMKAVADFA